MSTFNLKKKLWFFCALYLVIIIPFVLEFTVLDFDLEFNFEVYEIKTEVSPKINEETLPYYFRNSRAAGSAFKMRKYKEIAQALSEIQDQTVNEQELDENETFILEEKEADEREIEKQEDGLELEEENKERIDLQEVNDRDFEELEQDGQQDEIDVDEQEKNEHQIDLQEVEEEEEEEEELQEQQDEKDVDEQEIDIQEVEEPSIDKEQGENGLDEQDFSIEGDEKDTNEQGLTPSLSKKKYLAYVPSDGFGNQIISLIHAIYFGWYTGRVVIVPPILDHFEAPARGNCYDPSIPGFTNQNDIIQGRSSFFLKISILILIFFYSKSI